MSDEQTILDVKHTFDSALKTELKVRFVDELYIVEMNGDATTLVATDPLDALLIVAEMHPIAFKVLPGSEVNAQATLEIESALQLVLSTVPGGWDLQDWEAVEQDDKEMLFDDEIIEYSLLLDRIVRVNGLRWYVAECGAVLRPPLSRPGSSKSIAQIGFVETASMSAGWDAVHLFHDDGFIYRFHIKRSQERMRVEFKALTDKWEALDALVDLAATEFRDLYTRTRANPLDACMQHLLSTRTDELTVLGLDLNSLSPKWINDEKLQAEAPASPTSEWTFSVDKKFLLR